MSQENRTQKTQSTQSTQSTLARPSAVDVKDPLCRDRTNFLIGKRRIVVCRLTTTGRVRIMTHAQAGRPRPHSPHWAIQAHALTSGRLTPPARSLRQTGGLAETRVWARLRGGAVDGWKVRRQYPVGRFVVDFACLPLRLVIEIDGGVHGRDDVMLNDHLRQQEIEALGWTVVRFTNEQALGEPWRIDDAIRVQARALGS